MRLARGILPFTWTVAPAVAFEALAEHLYLSGDPLFYSVSGPRLEVFIASFFLGSLAAGSFLREFRLAAAVQLASLVALLFMVYYACDPRVCYSYGPDGLEPLRLGTLLGGVAISGVALCARPPGKWTPAFAAGASFTALAFYPVVFDLAGAKLLQPVHPWGVLALLFLAAFAAAHGTPRTLNKWERAAVPLVAFLVLLGITLGVAWMYLQSVSPDILFMAAAVAVGGAGGASAARWPRKATGALWGGGVLLLLVMTVLVIPDAVNGLVPVQGKPGLEMGVPVYVGGYQDSPPAHAAGAEVTVSLAAISATAVQPGNYLSAGLGVHSAGCCVDGIDYAYRFDVYYTGGGSAWMVASGWEVCDDNVACGGHSWKVLLLGYERPLESEASGNLTLRMDWRGSELEWSYSQGGGAFTNFTEFRAPPKENPNFNTGAAYGGSFTSQSGAYFYQFGISSLRPLGTGGWIVKFYCPSIEVNNTWSCIQHARTMQGGQSFWKVLWRWGEDYPGVVVQSPGPFVMTVSYSSRASGSYQVLW